MRIVLVASFAAAVVAFATSALAETCILPGNLTICDNSLWAVRLGRTKFWSNGTNSRDTGGEAITLYSNGLQSTQVGSTMFFNTGKRCLSINGVLYCN